ncbi:MAG: hypothetical protein L3K10_06695, partial [Thermoplasmata archaeon]|nr:hypothetical protein [Thermoplasmata archaeon]
EHVGLLARADEQDHHRHEAAVEQLGRHFGRPGFPEGDRARLQFPAYAGVEVRCVGHSLGGCVVGSGVVLSKALPRQEPSGYAVPGIEQNRTISLIPGTSMPKGRIHRGPAPT